MSDVKQGSEEWLQSRMGKVTASRVADVLAKTKSGYSTSRQNYAIELALERITGNRQAFYTNEAMKWGTEKEPFARAAYEAKTMVIVDEVALINHPTIAMAAASPDGVINDDGLVEFKCPIPATHLNTLVTRKPSGDYITQMMWQMACTNRKWCDFASYDPRFPEHLQLVVVRINRDDVAIKAMEDEVIKFLTEVDAMVQQINEMKV